MNEIQEARITGELKQALRNKSRANEAAERKRIKSKAYAALAFGVTLSTICLLALPPYWREVAGNMIGVLFLLWAAVLCARWAIGNVKHPPL